MYEHQRRCRMSTHHRYRSWKSRVTAARHLWLPDGDISHSLSHWQRRSHAATASVNNPPMSNLSGKYFQVSVPIPHVYLIQANRPPVNAMNERYGTTTARRSVSHQHDVQRSQRLARILRSIRKGGFRVRRESRRPRVWTGQALHSWCRLQVFSVFRALWLI